MTEDEMRDYLELFENDGIDPIYSIWDVRTNDKRLLIASHDEAVLCRYTIASPLASDEEKKWAQSVLGEFVTDSEAGEHRTENYTPAKSTVPVDEFLVAEIDWNALSAEKRKELLAGCGYWTGMSKEPWDNMLSTVQVLLARELERISGGKATFIHDEIMEEMRHEPGWEAICDPRLQRKAKSSSDVVAQQPPSSITPTSAKGRKTTRKRKK
jgi:hypothetical protein